ncbi:hypothetical protein PS1_035552 [Malus domestica]
MRDLTPRLSSPFSSFSGDFPQTLVSIHLQRNIINYQCGRSPNLGVNHDNSCVIYITCRFSVGFTLFQDLRFCASTFGAVCGNRYEKLCRFFFIFHLYRESAKSQKPKTKRNKRFQIQIPDYDLTHSHSLSRPPHKIRCRLPLPDPKPDKGAPISSTSPFRTRCSSAGSGLQEAPKSSEERKLSSNLYSSVPKLFDKKKAPRCGVGTASYINLGSAGDGR